nr:MAG TPA: hypothetical protein [Caudoviricetes sp.]
MLAIIKNFLSKIFIKPIFFKYFLIKPMFFKGLYGKLQ